MKIIDLLNMDAAAATDWLQENKDKIVLAPRELNPEIRQAFHESKEDFDEGINEIKGSPDDQWDAMVSAIEAPGESIWDGS